jgi:hypothetical protein
MPVGTRTLGGTTRRTRAGDRFVYAHRSSDSTELTFRLRSIHSSVTGADVLDSPPLATLLVEDWCWHLAVDDWRSRRPQPWRRVATRRWLSEEKVLIRELWRIEQQARACRLLT